MSSRKTCPTVLDPSDTVQTPRSLSPCHSIVLSLLAVSTARQEEDYCSVKNNVQENNSSDAAQHGKDSLPTKVSFRVLRSAAVAS
jgi:hypothetical protein